MADGKYSCRVRGRLASVGKTSKSDRMRKINNCKKEVEERTEHDYTAPHDDDYVNLTDIGVGENVDLSDTCTKPWFEGRRVVELAVLSQAMNCERCSAWLRLADIVDEVVYGLASYLYIRCSNSACNHITLVPTGKRNSNKGFDVNYKVCLGNFLL